MNNSTLDIIKSILDKQMSMPDGRVWAENGTQDLPQDNNLFIILSFIERIPYSNISRYKQTENGLQEIQTTNMSEEILISLISRSTEARDRAQEVLMALTSDFSQYTQEINKIHISRTGMIGNSSFLEATSRLHRWDVSCRVIRTYEQIQDIDYYNKFPNTSQFEPEWFTD